MAGYIYKHWLGDKYFYVGQHKYDKPEIDPNYDGSGGHLFQSKYKVYGVTKKELLEWCDTPEELNAREVYWIQHEKALFIEGEGGLNWAPGGLGNNNQHIPEDIRKEKFGSQNVGNKYSLGREGKCKDKKMYHKGTERKFFIPGEEPNGWEVGEIEGKVSSNSDGHNMRGKIWCSNGVDELVVNSLEDTPVGYTPNTRLPNSKTSKALKEHYEKYGCPEETRNKLRNAQKGKKMCNNGVRNSWRYPEDIDGVVWVLGKLKTPKTSRVEV